MTSLNTIALDYNQHISGYRTQDNMGQAVVEDDHVSIVTDKKTVHVKPNPGTYHLMVRNTNGGPWSVVLNMRELYIYVQS